MIWEERYASKRSTPDAAALKIPRGRRIFLSSGASEPLAMVEALTRNASHFSDNVIEHLMTLGPAPYVAEEYISNFRHNAFFIGANVRKAVWEGRADYTPVFLSQIPRHIRSGLMSVDVAIIQCSPPDAFGFVNLGVSVDIVLAAVEAASLVIAEINPNVPVIHGAGFLPMDAIDHWIWNDEPLLEAPPTELNEVALEIGRNVSSLIGDGSTIQMGIGQIPDAVLKALVNHKDLGVWTEMFSDGVLDLIEAGVITGRYKKIHPGKVSASFAFGSKRLYDALHQNPTFTFHPSDYINDPVRISRQPKMVSINSALEVDLTGQVCADSIGTKFFSGIGGQVDFVRGASMSEGGTPIIALPSTAKGGTVSRIAPILSPGAGVVTSRGDVRFVVTEYGIADLMGKTIRERAKALLSIAHPDFREELLDAAKERRYVFKYQLPPKGNYPIDSEKIAREIGAKKVVMRPIRPTDEDKLSAFFYRLDETTIYKRYLHVVKDFKGMDTEQIVNIDYKSDMSLVLVVHEKGAEPEIHGVAQYFKDKETGYAEVAFMLADAWQGRGFGRQLMGRLLYFAEKNGVKGFTASLLETNHAMLALFHKTGGEVSATLSDGIYNVRLPFCERTRLAVVAGG